MKNKCKFLPLLAFVLMFLFYKIDSTAAIADIRSGISSADAVRPATVSGTEQTISTGQALIEWLESHKDTGGTVKLADNVVLDGDYSYCPNGMNRPDVFVDTDKYVITVTGEIEFFSDNHLIFSGQPEGKSIFHVAEKGMLSMQGAAVESGQCALWQEEGAGLVVDGCHISGSIHYADTPFVTYKESICVVVEKGQTVNDVLPAQIRCDVNSQGQVSHNELLPLSWNLKGTEQQQEERRRFQMQGSFLHASSAEPALCTVAYNDYPLTFTDVRASVRGSWYLFQGWYTKPEECLPITVISEYSFDGENWVMCEEENVTDIDAAFSIVFESESCDRAAHPNIYIRLQWNDNGTRYFSNVLCYAADNLEYAQDIGGNRGGGTAIINPPDKPQKSIGDTSSEDVRQLSNTESLNINKEQPLDTGQRLHTNGEQPLDTEQRLHTNEKQPLNSNEKQPLNTERPATNEEQPVNTEQLGSHEEQPSNTEQPHTNEEQPLYAVLKAVNAGQSSYLESKTDNDAGNMNNSDNKEGIHILQINGQARRPDIRQGNNIAMAIGCVLLSVIAGIAGFCVHSRSGTNR